MFAVVVLLTKPRAHTIVPENYIYGLKELEDNLKTWGANKKHDHLIFWSQNLLNDDTVPDETIQPNFSSASYDVFPPPPQVKAACYIGRIKRFFKSFDAAKQYCNRFRPVLPVPYNPNILNNQPTPPNNVDGQNIENEQENEQENDANSENSGNDNEVGESDEPISENDQEIGLESAENDHQSSDAEQKFVLAPVNLDQSDIIALDSLFDIEDFSSDGENLAVGGFESLDNTTHQNPPQFEAEDNGSAINENQTNEMNSNHSNNQIIDTTNSQEPNNDDTTNGEADENVSNEEINILLRSYKPAENEKVALTQDGRIAITKAIDDELEMTFVLGEQLLPIEDRFQIKMNDALSGNMPFQENEQKDRAYLIKVNGVFQEVKFSGRVVKWLIGMNVEHRAQCDVDKSFIKALLIVVFSVRTIKSGDSLEEDLTAFIKDLFVQRIGDDTARLSSFENLITVACDEIRQL